MPTAALHVHAWLQVWALPTQRFAYTLSGHANWVRACQFSPDGRLALSGGDDKTVKVRSKDLLGKGFSGEAFSSASEPPWHYSQALRRATLHR